MATWVEGTPLRRSATAQRAPTVGAEKSAGVAYGPILHHRLGLGVVGPQSDHALDERMLARQRAMAQAHQPRIVVLVQGVEHLGCHHVGVLGQHARNPQLRIGIAQHDICP